MRLMSRPRRLATCAAIALCLVWVMLAVVAYHMLPATVATHVGRSGRAAHVGPTSMGRFFLMTGVGVAVAMLLLVLAQWAHRKPEIFNLTCKAELLALPSKQRSPFLEEIALWVTLMASLIVLTLALVQYDSWRVSMQVQRGLSLVSVAAIVIYFSVMVFGIPLWLLSFDKRVMDASARVRNGSS